MVAVVCCLPGRAKDLPPEPLRIGLMRIWCFWLRISSGIKYRSNDLNSWDTLCIYYNATNGRDSTARNKRTTGYGIRYKYNLKTSYHVRLFTQKNLPSNWKCPVVNTVNMCKRVCTADSARGLRTRDWISNVAYFWQATCRNHFKFLN